MTFRRNHLVLRRRQWRASAFTLAELMVSLGIMAVLMSAMASAVLIATHALPDGNSPLEASVRAAEVLDEIAGDLVYATDIKGVTATGVTFTVADRGHGAVGPETIRIAWSGTAGDPLLRRYNSGVSVSLCDNVQSFSMAFAKRPGGSSVTSNLLFVTSDAASPPAADVLKIAKFESWGYIVQTITEGDPTAAFDTAISGSDVIFVSEYIWGMTLGSKVAGRSIGVVTEDQFTLDNLGFSSSAWYDVVDTINILDNTHEITSGMALGTLTICSTFEPLGSTAGTLAPGALVLADSSGSPSLVVLETGATQYDGSLASSRRVKLPWGGFAFINYDFTSLNTAALTIMRRSLAWAAEPTVYSGVRIQLQIGTVGGSASKTSIQLLNTPKAG